MVARRQGVGLHDRRRRRGGGDPARRILQRSTPALRPVVLSRQPTLPQLQCGGGRQTISDDSARSRVSAAPAQRDSELVRGRAAAAEEVTALEHFQTFGWIRIPTAFSADDASAMCDVIWDALSTAGIRRDDPSTWTTARPEHLQHLKAHPVFQAIGSARTLRAIDEVLEGQPWERPREWGAFFLQFPVNAEWTVPSHGWHVDGDYTGRL